MWSKMWNVFLPLSNIAEQLVKDHVHYLDVVDMRGWETFSFHELFTKESRNVRCIFLQKPKCQDITTLFFTYLHFSLLQIVVPLITPSKLGIFAQCLQVAKIHQLEPLWSPKLSLTFASQIEQFLVDEFMLCIPPLQCGQKIQNISFSTISAVEHLGH